MLRSKDKTICDKEHTLNKFSLFTLSLAPRFLFFVVFFSPPSSGILRDITPLYQEKPEYIILYKAPFYKKNLCTQTQISFYDTI